MSRIGRMPITVPAGVEVNVAENNVVTVKGPKGELTQALRPEMIITMEDGHIHVARPSEDKLHRSLHGLTEALGCLLEGTLAGGLELQRKAGDHDDLAVLLAGAGYDLRIRRRAGMTSQNGENQDRA